METTTIRSRTNEILEVFTVGTQKKGCKTAAVMNLLGRGAAAEKRPLAEMLARPVVSNSDTTGREQIEYIDMDRIDDDPNNFYELSGLDELAANIEMLGLQQPIRVRPGEEPWRYVIVSGHRRRAAVRQLVMDGRRDLRELPCIVDRSAGSAALHELKLICANSDTRKLTSADLGRQAERITALLYQLEGEGYKFPGRMRDYVAEACKVSKSKLARLKVIRENLAEPWRTAYEAGKLAESTAYALAQMPAGRQKIICDGLTRQGIMPGSAQEYMVRGCGESLARVEAVECTTYGNGPCLNREAMRERIMSQKNWGYSYCRQCCGECPELARCRYSCHLLADRVKQLKADDKSRKEQEKKAREEKARPKTEAIKSMWVRFGEARTAAGKSVGECYAAAGLSYSETDAEKRIEEHEKMERLCGTFSDQTDLPYAFNYHYDVLQRYVRIAGLLGVSLDYLLCRTDDPAGLADRPQPEGQLVFNGWMPGGTLPGQACDAVADFDFGTGAVSRMVCRFDGRHFLHRNVGKVIERKPIRWMVLPPV